MNRSLGIISIIFLFICVLTGYAATHRTNSIDTPRGFAGTLYKSTLALYGSDGSNSNFICTTEPFEKIPNGYHLISAGHCVQDMPIDTVFFVSNDIGGSLIPVKVLKVYEGDGLDFAEFELITGRHYSIIKLGNEYDSKIGDLVINPNFALGLGKQLSLGKISSDILPVSSECSVDDCAGEFLVQSYGGSGASGSAIVSAKTHKIIGLVIAGFTANIGFGVEPISLFYKFLAGPNQPHPSPKVIIVNPTEDTN